MSATWVSRSSLRAVATWKPSTVMVVPATVPTPMVSMCTPASAASAAAASASGPPVSSPSDSSTIVADPQ